MLNSIPCRCHLSSESIGTYCTVHKLALHRAVIQPHRFLQILTTLCTTSDNVLIAGLYLSLAILQGQNYVIAFDRRCRWSGHCNSWFIFNPR